MIIACPIPLLAHDDPHQSIEKITLEIKQDPDNVELYLKRAELHRISSHWDMALADLEYAAELDPDLIYLNFYRGRLHFEAGRLPQAKLALDFFLSSHPNHVEGLITRGRILRKLNQPLKAAQDYAHALSMTSNPTPVLFTERAESLVESGEGYADMAVQGLDEGIQKLGPLVSLESPAIDLDVKLQRYDRALARIDRVMAKMNRKEKWLVRRGDVLAKAGRSEEARSTYEAALNALESLPVRFQQIPASRELAARIRAILESNDL
jgi:tetratricopeptide (TPR) repeat protein